MVISGGLFAAAFDGLVPLKRRWFDAETRRRGAAERTLKEKL
jgi:hypothetical protein